MSKPLLDYFASESRISFSLCLDSGWETVTTGETRYARRCRCSGIQHLTSYLDQAQIPPRFAGCDLTRYRALTPQQQLAKVVAERYVEDLSPDGLGLVIYGESGVGKTHLAASILHQLIAQYGARGRFCSVPDLIRLFTPSTDTFNRARGRGKQEKSEYLCRLEKAEILLLDDLTVLSPHRKSQETINHLLGIRYATLRPVIITTQLPPVAERENVLSLQVRLGPMTASRVQQMCRFFQLVGCDLRRELARGIRVIG